MSEAVRLKMQNLSDNLDFLKQFSMFKIVVREAVIT